MKKLNKILNIKALLLVILTCVGAISASAQAVVSTATFPTGLIVGQEATFTFNAAGFDDGVTFILWHDADLDGDLGDDEMILGSSTVDDGTDQDLDFTVPSGIGTLNMRFAGFTGSTQAEETTSYSADEVSVVGSDESAYAFTFDATSTRQLTTDAYDASGTDPIFIDISFGFQNFDDDNPGEFQYSTDGFATAGVALDFNGDAVAGGLEVVNADGTNFSFALPTAAKTESTSLRIVQTGTVNYGTGKSWQVASISYTVGDAYALEAGDYDNDAITPDNTTPAFSNEAVTVPSIAVTAAEDDGTNAVAGAAITVYPGDEITIEGTVSGLAGITAGKGVVAVLRDNDGNEIGAIGSDASIDDVSEAYAITATIPTTIDYNSGNNWDIVLKPFEGDSPELGIEVSNINFTALSGADEFDEEDFTIEGGERADGEGIVFDQSGSRSVLSPEFNITGTAGELIIDVARKNDVTSGNNANIVFEYTTNGTDFTELNSFTLNEFEVDNNSTTYTLEEFPAGMVSSSTQIRVRQVSNNGADLDAFIIRNFSIENESNIISSDEVAQGLVDDLDIERPVIAFNQIDIDGGSGDGKAFPTESQTLTFDITDGLFPTDASAELFFDRDDNGLDTDFDLSLGSIEDITSETITFTVPAIDGGTYDLYLVTSNDSEYSAVPLTVFELTFNITSIDITDPVTVGETEFVNPGGSITVNYERTEGDLGADAKVMLKLLDDNGDYIMVGQEADASAAGSITATLPFDFDYPAGSSQTIQLSVTNGDGVVNYDATVRLVSFENFSQNDDLSDDEIFDSFVGGTTQSDGSVFLNQAGERIITSAPFDISNGGELDRLSIFSPNFSSSFNVQVEASINGADWEEIGTIVINGSFIEYGLFNYDIPNSLQSSQTQFRIIYNTENEFAADENVIEFYRLYIDIPEFLETANTTETFQLLRPSLSVNAYDDTDFINSDDVSVNFNAIGFPSGTEFALVLRQGRGQGDEEYVVIATGTVDENDNGTLAGMLPSVLPLGDNNGDGFDLEIVPFTPASAGGDYIEGESISFSEEDDFLVGEGGSLSMGAFTFNEVGERSVLSNAIDLSSTNGATLNFTTSTSFDINSNQNLVPRLEISTDGGATFNVVNVEDLAEGEEAMFATGLLYEARTYEVELTVGGAETHFRFSQPLNVGENKNTWNVSGISVTVGDDNTLASGTYTTTGNNPQTVTLQAPSVSNFEFVQNDLQDAVFNSETFVASFDIKSELNVDNVALYPSGTLFEFYIQLQGGNIVNDPDTDLPLIIGSTSALGTFNASIPFYVDNGDYDVLVAVSQMVDDEKVYYVGDETTGTDVGDLTIFQRVVRTVSNFPENDVLYGGESITFSIDIENDASLTIDDSDLFANLLVIDPFGTGDDLLIASQQGTGDITVDLPTYLNGNPEFKIELTETAALGEVGEMIGAGNSLTNLEDELDNIQSLSVGDYSVSTPVYENDNSGGIYARTEFDFGYTGVGGGTVRLYQSENGEAWEQINSYTIGNNGGRYTSGYEYINVGSTIQYRWILEGGDSEDQVTISNVVIEDFFNTQYESYSNSDLTPDNEIGGQLRFNNDFGRGLITMEEIESGTLEGKTLISFDISIDKAGDELLADNFVTFEFSNDGGATYTALGTYPDADEEDPLVDENVKIEVTDAMVNNNTIFRFRQEERNEIGVFIDNFSFLDAEILPFTYVSTNQSIAQQRLFATTTSVAVAEACFDDEISIGYEARGIFGADNEVTILLQDVDNGDIIQLVQKASVVSGTGTLTLSLDVDEDNSDRAQLIQEGDSNREFKVSFSYKDETAVESIEDISDADLTIERTDEVFSEGDIEIVAPIDQDASMSVTSSTLLCAEESLTVEVDNPQDYFTYEVLNSDTDEVLGTLTYDPDLDDREIDLGMITEDIDLVLQVMSASSSGAVSCNTILSSSVNEVEFDDNFILTMLNNFSTYDEVTDGQTINICEGGSVTLNLRRELGVSATADNVEWFRDNINTPLADSDGTLINDGNGINDRSGSYFARITDGDCVYTTVAVNVVVEESPEKPEITVVSGNLTGCSEEDVVVLSAPDGFAYYLWSNGEETQTIEVDLTVTGSSESSSVSRTVQVSNRPFNLSCGSVSSDAVVVERYRNVDFNLSTSANIASQILEGDVLEVCGSERIYFHDEFINTVSSATFYGTVEVIRDGVVVGTRTNTSFADLTESGVYSFRYLNDGNGIDVNCSATSESFTLTVVETPDRPEISVTSGTLDGCVGDGPVTLTAPAGFAYYSWSNGVNAESITVDPTAATTNYTVRVSNSANNEVSCLSATSNQITVRRQYISDFSVRSSTSINTGTSITDGMTVDGCDAGYTVHFYDGTSRTASGGIIEVVRDGVVVNTTTSNNTTLTESGDYSFNWMNSTSNGCTVSSGTFTLNLADTPDAPVISTTDNLSFCEGEGSVTIDGPAGFAQYRWIKDGNVISSNANGSASTNSSITVTDAGIYTLEVSNIADQNACFSNRSNSITVSSRQIAFDNTTEDQLGTICGPGSGTIEVTGTLDTYNYELVNEETGAVVGAPLRGTGGGDPLLFTTESISEDTDYYIQVSYADGEGCVDMDINPNNRITARVNNFVLELSGNTITAVIYGSGSSNDIEWFRNGVRLRNRSGYSSIDITDAAEYSAELDFGGGCVITSNTIALEAGARINTNFASLSVTSYPNPTADMVTVSLTDGPMGAYNISVISVTGQIVMERVIDKTENEHEETLDLSALDNGVYNVTIRRGNSVENVRIIKQ